MLKITLFYNDKKHRQKTTPVLNLKKKRGPTAPILCRALRPDPGRCHTAQPSASVHQFFDTSSTFVE